MASDQCHIETPLRSQHCGVTIHQQIRCRLCARLWCFKLSWSPTFALNPSICDYAWSIPLGLSANHYNFMIVLSLCPGHRIQTLSIYKADRCKPYSHGFVVCFHLYGCTWHGDDSRIPTLETAVYEMNLRFYLLIILIHFVSAPIIACYLSYWLMLTFCPPTETPVVYIG